jgi:hypothetical protein
MLFRVGAFNVLTACKYVNESRLVDDNKEISCLGNVERLANAISMIRTEADGASRMMVMMDSLANDMVRLLRNFQFHDEVEGSIAVLCE